MHETQPWHDDHEPSDLASEGIPPPMRVVVADDQPIVRAGIVYALEGYEDLQVVGQAGNGADTLRLVERLHPDVVLLDLLMPGMDGLAALKEMHQRVPEIPVLALTADQHGDMVQQTLQSGALGYLLKDMTADELVSAIRLARVGKPSLAPAAAQVLVQQASKGPSLGHDLTAREHEVLALVVAGRSNQDIADALFITPATVKFHVRNVKRKLGTSSRTETVVVALRNRLVPPLS